MIKRILEDYDLSFYEEGLWVGSKWKIDMIKLRKLPALLKKRDAFCLLIDSLLAICKSHYEALDEQDLKQRFTIAVKYDDDNTLDDEPQASSFSLPQAMFDDQIEEEHVRK